MGAKPLPRGQEMARLARRQHGVVSIRQLRRLGYSHSSVRRAVVAGRLHRLHHGVYAVGHTNLSLQGRCLAAVLASGPRALLSHYSAGWLLGLIATRPVPVHVTTPVPRKRRGSVRIHHSRTLIDADRALEEGIPVTSVARTALDLAAVVRFRTLRRLIRRSEELRVFDLGDFRSVLARNRGHRGALRLSELSTSTSPRASPAPSSSGSSWRSLNGGDCRRQLPPSTSPATSSTSTGLSCASRSNWTSTRRTERTSRSRRIAAETRT